MSEYSSESATTETDFMDDGSIETSESTAKIIPAIIAAEKEIGDIAKGGWNSHQRYNYTQLKDVIGATKGQFLANGIAIVFSATDPRQLPISDEEITAKAKSGKQPQRTTEVTVTARLMHESGEWIQVRAVGQGADAADKGAFKATTGGMKYALLMVTNSATTDDPEADGPGKYAPGSNGNGDKKPSASSAVNGNGGKGTKGKGPTDDEMGNLIIDACRLTGTATSAVVRYLKDGSEGRVEKIADATPALRKKVLKAVQDGSLLPPPDSDVPAFDDSNDIPAFEGDEQ